MGGREADSHKASRIRAVMTRADFHYLDDIQLRANSDAELCSSHGALVLLDAENWK